VDRTDPTVTRSLFESAGQVKHAADAELGLVRTYMQAGEYRRALACASRSGKACPLGDARRRPTARPTAHEDRIYFRCGLGRE